VSLGDQTSNVTMVNAGVLADTLYITYHRPTRLGDSLLSGL
jgi:hypothetical protein